MPRILIVLTSHGTLGNSGQPTGWWLSEVTHFLHEVGTTSQIDFASPQGGAAPVDPGSLTLTDPVNASYWQDNGFREKIAHTLPPEKIQAELYDAVYYPGGHGPMWDLANDSRFAAITRIIWEKGGVIAAACHGPAALLPVTLSDGTPLLRGKTVTGFSNLEELLVRKKKYVPFLLEDALRHTAGRYTKSWPGLAHIETDGHLVTGQNPRSVRPLGRTVLQLLS